MALSVNSPTAILNIVDLILTIIVAGLIGDVDCVNLMGMRTQYISGVVYGYLIISAIVTIAIFIPGNLDRNLRLIIHGAGSVLWIAAAALLLQSADQGICSLTIQEEYDRTVAGGVLGLAVFIIHAIECFFSWRYLAQ